ncbi:unnamed protein product [Sphagnum jensenii]|uniref:Transcriptional regulatory protein n=1 Tax=Sphagnum jensenii TaxID=128206 RepID=A0ABP1ALL5_9BRYO
MGRKSYFSESDVMPLVKRYTSSTLLTLLREIAKCETAKLDWDALVKSSATGISSAREYQALWRSLAYRVELKQCFEEDECPLDDESDLEFELEPVPPVSMEVAGDVSMCVKVFLKTQLDMSFRSECMAGSTLSGSSSGAGTVASNTSLKGIPTANNGALHVASNKQFAVVPSASNDSALLSGALCQTDRKKRRLWTPEEDLELIAAVEKCGEGNWATILKCGFNHERTASQLSQRWALIRKRREVAEKAGYRVGPGYSASTPGSSGQAGASPFVTPAVSSPGSLEPALNGNTGSAIPGHAPSTSVPGGHVGSPAGVPMSATQSPPSVAQNVQGQGTGSVAVYAMNSSAANTMTNTYSKANNSRPATGLDPMVQAAAVAAGARIAPASAAASLLMAAQSGNVVHIGPGGRTARNVGVMWEYPGSHVPQGTRQIFILPPTQMGRRSAKIATRKGAQDKKKSKLYGKIGKQIITLVKEGGPSPAANPALAVLLQQAKEADVPKDIIDRNLKKATDKGQADFVELTYEVYGYGGVGLVLEVLTDNFNRAAATIRDVVKKGGAKMADSGSVLFNFKRAGVIYVKADSVKSDELLLAAMDAGAEDVLEPEADEDEDNDKEEEKYFQVITSLDQFSVVRGSLQEAGVPFDADISGPQLIPITTVKTDDEAMELNKVLTDKLLELDDVDAVYSNQK